MGHTRASFFPPRLLNAAKRPCGSRWIHLIRTSCPLAYILEPSEEPCGRAHLAQALRQSVEHALHHDTRRKASIRRRAAAAERHWQIAMGDAGARVGLVYPPGVRPARTNL